MCLVINIIITFSCADAMNLYNQTMLSVAKHTDPIAPITEQQMAEVKSVTLDYIALAQQIYKKSFPSIPIVFDLRGKCAGMYRRNGRDQCIRFNPWLFAKYYQHSIGQTIPHEVAHYITDCLFYHVCLVFFLLGLTV